MAQDRRREGATGRGVTAVVVDTGVALAGDESDTARLRHRLRVVRTEAAAHGGALVRVCGHGAVVCFVGPACALRFAEAVRRALADEGPGVRIGMHTAPGAAGDADGAGGGGAGGTTGLAARLAAVAARLVEVADPGEVVASPAVVDAGAAPGPVRVAEGVDVAALLAPSPPRAGQVQHLPPPPHVPLAATA